MPGMPPSIVIADDNPDDLFFARRAVGKAAPGTTVLTCADGRETVELLTKIIKEQRPVPQVVFLDIKMPNLDGFETLRWIRDQKPLDGVSVVMLSGSAEVRDIELARSLGAADYFVKYPTAAEFARALSGAQYAVSYCGGGGAPTP